MSAKVRHSQENQDFEVFLFIFFLPISQKEKTIKKKKTSAVLRFTVCELRSIKQRNEKANFSENNISLCLQNKNLLLLSITDNGKT